MNRRPKDRPLYDVAAAAETLVRQGCDVYQKWTCAKCGDRVTANEPNRFTTHGHHEDCGHTTDLRIAGCGFAAHASTAAGHEALLKYMRR